MIGIGQFFDFFFADADNEIRVPLNTSISYSDDNGRTFSESFTIDLSTQLPVMTVTSDVEKLTNAVLKISNELRIHR